MKSLKLVSTLSRQELSFSQLDEFTPSGESLEIQIPSISQARQRPGRTVAERFADFMPFGACPPEFDLQEGNTPLLPAASSLKEFSGLQKLLLKDETRNPTWSFKDRGTMPCVQMALAHGESMLCTVSTGNMGHSVAAYAARAGLGALVFVPHFAPDEKLRPMLLHGGKVVRVQSPDYAEMKKAVLSLGKELGLRIVSGNGPIRTEGYKQTAFELFEQLDGHCPDYVAIPTSACGHLRGVFKGFVELKTAGMISKLPIMIVVQAARISPLVSAMKQGLEQVVPVPNADTIAEAITSGNPQGGDEILDKAKRFGWLGESAEEDEILQAQTMFARAGHFVEASSATTLVAVAKLRAAGKINPDASVVLMLTGSGLKHMEVMHRHRMPVVDCTVPTLHQAVAAALQ